MKIVLDKKRVQLYTWIGVIFLFLHVLGDWMGHADQFAKRTMNHTWMAVYLLPLNFLLLEYILPFIRLTWKRVLAGLILLFALMLLYSIGAYAWRLIGISLHSYYRLKVYSNIEVALENSMAYSMGSVAFYGIVRYTHDHRKLKQRTQQLLIEKQQAELNYLKSQTNPHFLFNTLNNIYSLARDKSDLAPESILRLSKILRYMLYETSGKYVAIEQELKIMSDYIALEKLRYDDSLLVNFNHDIEDMRQSLPPLLLLPLVENAFKHGVSETRERPFVDIHLSVKQRRLALVVKNSAEVYPAAGIIKEHIGLANLRRQLELLYKEYTLSVQQDGAMFIASLNINLSSYV